MFEGMNMFGEGETPKAKAKAKAIINDSRVAQMATYYETHGLMKQTAQEDISKRFCILKRIIQRGSFTIDEVEERIYTQFGLVSLTDDQKKFEENMKITWALELEDEKEEKEEELEPNGLG